MSRVLGALLITSLPAFAAIPAILPSAVLQQPTFRSTSSELVVLPVTVLGKHHAPVGDLPREAFTVYDNGRREDITLFTNEDTPVTVGLVIDASSSMRRKLAEVVAAAMTFARLSNPDDELFAIRFNDDVKKVTGDELSVRAADSETLRQALLSIRPDGRTALYDGLMAAFDELDRGSRPRKVLILISDGGDNASRATREQVLERARRSNAAIYTIGLFDEMDPDRNPGLLKSLARDTGGERFEPASPGPMLGACERIAREIRAGYTIGYPPPDRDAAFHHVRVEARSTEGRPLEVRTRPGYFAAGQATR